MRESAIQYRDGDAVLTGFLVDSTADMTEKSPGVLVVHGGAGLDDHARDRARRIAALGYTVLACDMYGNDTRGDPDRVRATIADLITDPDALRRRADAALDLLAAQHGGNGRMAAVGYCFGGTVVLTLARLGVDLAGVASIHGGLTTTHPATPGTIRARILVCHGGADPHVPADDVTAFTKEMLAAGADWQLHVHPGAQHGFTHTHLARSPSPIPGVAYDPTADARSSATLRTFLTSLFSG